MSGPCPHCGGELVGEEKPGAPPYECETCGWKVGDIAPAISWEELAKIVGKGERGCACQWCAGRVWLGIFARLMAVVLS